MYGKISGNRWMKKVKLSDIILITGGLGPTADDITKPLLCQYFGGKLVVDEEALDNVKQSLKNLNRPLMERNLKQAEVPDVLYSIQNKRGTAPGMWFEKDGKIFISMPGVPHEMKGMMIRTMCYHTCKQHCNYYPSFIVPCLRLVLVNLSWPNGLKNLNQVCLPILSWLISRTMEW